MMRYKTFKQSGFTVVELMVGLLLSLILVAGILQVYLGSKTTYRVTEGLSRLQENTRASAEMLAKDIRMAGYIPCSQPQNAVSIVDSNAWWAQLFNTPILGFEGDTSTTLPPTNLVANAKVGSDAIMVLRGGARVAGVQLFDASNNQFILQRDVESSWVEDGSLMIACDSSNARLFQASNVGTDTVTLADNAAVPGNNGAINHSFGNDAQIANYSAVIYYITASSSGSSSGNGFSLYRSYLNVNGAGENAPETEELAEGIENMQLLYGYDSTGDGIANRYLRANDALLSTAADWQNVVAVRIGLLYASEDGLREGNDLDDNRYVVANTLIGPSTTVSHEEDQRKRYVASMTVSLRNL